MDSAPGTGWAWGTGWVRVLEAGVVPAAGADRVPAARVDRDLVVGT